MPPQAAKWIASSLTLLAVTALSDEIVNRRHSGARSEPQVCNCTPGNSDSGFDASHRPGMTVFYYTPPG